MRPQLLMSDPIPPDFRRSLASGITEAANVYQEMAVFNFGCQNCGSPSDVTAPAAGTALVWGVAQIRLADIGGQATYIGCQAQVGPQNPSAWPGTPLGRASGVFGDGTGSGSALIVGRNLGLTMGAYTRLGIDFPGFNSDATPRRVTARNRSETQIWPFPPGAWQVDVAPTFQRAQYSAFFSPAAARMGDSDAIEVGICFAPTLWLSTIAAAGVPVPVDVSGQLVFARTLAPARASLPS